MLKVGKIIAVVLAAFGLLGLMVAADMKGSFAVIAIIGIALFVWLNKKQPEKAAKRQQKPQTKPQSAAPAKARIKNILLPSRLEGQPLVYNYSMDIVPADGVDIVKDVLVDSEKACPVDVEGEHIAIFADGKKVAEIQNSNRARMVGDWLRQGRPVHAILLASGDKAQLRFYDDPRPRNAFREQTVVELIAYKSKAMQEVSAFLSEGDPLKIEEGDSSPDKLYVWANGETIGRLPAKIEARALEAEPWGVFVEEVKEEETDDGDTIYHPIVRIFW